MTPLFPQRSRPTGRVYLVGAGPGRPDLLTLRGAECLRRADVVLLDALVDRRLLSHCPPGVRVMDAGKRGDGRVRMRQPEINRWLVRWARRGKTVVRLKGGDPYFFGRGAEEASLLAQKNIPFEVVPGVSAVTSVPGFAGIPLTHRGHASVVTVVTGQEGRANAYLGESVGQVAHRRGPGVDWSKISPQGTLVILMGIKRLSALADKLIRLGWSPQIPAAVIQWGSWSCQKTVRASLGDLARRVKTQGMGAPAVIVVGAVAGKSETLNWFEKRPLFGKTVLVTRAREQASSLCALLEERGACVIESPLISLHPLPPRKSDDKFLRNLAGYDGLFVTSTNGADAVAQRCRGHSLPPVYAVGEKTAAALRDRSLPVFAVAETFQAEGLVRRLGPSVRGKRYLWVRAKEGRDVIATSLARWGARVDLWPLYETKGLSLSPEAKEALLKGQIHAVTFTSSSTARSLLRQLTPGQRRRVFAQTRAVSIGPVTSATLRVAGLAPVQAAGAATIENLADAAVRALSSRPGGRRR